MSGWWAATSRRSLGNQLRRLGARYKHRTDHEVGAAAESFDRLRRGKHCAQTGIELRRGAPERMKVTCHDHVGAHAERYERRIRAHHTAAEYDDIGRRHARDTAKQDSASTIRFFQVMGTDLRRHAHGD